MTAIAHSFHLRLLDRFELRSAGRVIPVTDRAAAPGHLSGPAQPAAAARSCRGHAMARGASRPRERQPTGQHLADAVDLPAMQIDLSMRHVNLGADICIDLTTAVALAERLLDRSNSPATRVILGAAARSVLSDDLLSDCYDEWVLVECERFHQLRLHALEALCERLTAAERYGEAIDARPGRGLRRTAAGKRPPGPDQGPFRRRELRRGGTAIRAVPADHAG